MRPHSPPPRLPFRCLVAVVSFALVSCLTAGSLVVDFTQGAQPSPAAPSITVSAAVEALYTGDAPPHNQTQLAGTVQYRWKWEFGGLGTVSTSNPASGNDGWSEWGNFPQATASGTFDQAGLLDLVATAEARVVDENGAPLTAAASGSASEAVTSVGLYGVEVYNGDTWNPVGGTFAGLPNLSYTFRAIRWPLDSEWPAGVPTWSVDGTPADTGTSFELTMSTTAGSSKTVSVTDGAVVLTFAAVATPAHASLGSILHRPYGSTEWTPGSGVATIFAWEGSPQYEFRIVKDEASLPWHPGYPTWQTLTTHQAASGDTIAISHPGSGAPEREVIRCEWGPSSYEYVQFFLQYRDGAADFIIECPPCLPLGKYAYPSTGYMQYVAAWSVNPAVGIVEYREPLDRELTLVQGDPNNWHPYVCICATGVGEATLAITWPRDEFWYPHPATTSGSKPVRVLDLIGLHAVCDAPISESLGWPPSDAGATANVTTKYVPAILGTVLRATSTYDGANPDDRLYLRQVIDYTWGTTEARLYDRAQSEFNYAQATINRVGTYTCRAGVDYYGTLNARLDTTQETLASLVIQAVGLDSFAVVCESGNSTLLDQSSSEKEQNAFYAWPDKTGSALSVTVGATVSATHDQWPASYPQWSGCSSSAGTAGSSGGVATSVNSATVTTPGTTEIEVECGNAIAVHLHGVQIDLDAPGVAEGDETATNGGVCFQTGDTARVALTVNRAPVALDRGTIRISCSGTTGGFRLWSGASTRFPSASFPGTVSSVDLPLGSGTTVGNALPATIYLEPTGTSFATTLTIRYLDPAGETVDNDSLYIHTSY